MSMTAAGLAQQQHVARSTICAAIRRAGLDVARGATYTTTQQEQILHSLRKAPRTAEQPAQHNETKQQNDALLVRVAQLEAEVAALKAQQNVLIGWGRNAAQIIRLLWHRMPDYQTGDTPGEFPTIKRDTSRRPYPVILPSWCATGAFLRARPFLAHAPGEKRQF